MRVAIKKKRAQLVSDGTIMRKSALAALYKNKERLDDFLSSDLNASSHAQIANLAYRLSGLETKDKRAEKSADTGAVHVININLNRHGQGDPKTISVSAPARNRQDIGDGEIVGEE